MEIRCSKEIKINKYESILTLETLIEREDIAKFLEEKLESDEEIDIKIKKMLMNEKKLIEEDLKTLTEEGKKVLESKKIWENQKGEFEVYTLEDSFMSRIIGIEGANAFSLKSNTEKFDDKIISSEIESKINGEKYRIMEEVGFVKKDENYKETISLEWSLNKKKEEISIKYPNNFKVKDSNESKDINCEEFIADYVQIHGLEYNSKLEKVEYGEKELKSLSTEEKNKFSCNKFNVNEKLGFRLKDKYVEFDKITIYNIGVMPNSKECAKEWSLENFKSRLKDEYITEKKYDDILNKVYDRNEIRYWEVDKLLREDFIKNNFYELKNSNSNCYWNIAAPFDLLSGNILPRDVIQFNYGEEISLKKFVERITENIERDRIKDVVLIDNYTFTDNVKGKNKGILGNKKIRIIELLKNLINPKEEFIIYTQEKDWKKVEDKIISNFTLMSNNNITNKHSRYLFFIMDDGDLKSLTIDRSIDFIDYNDIDFDENTIGKSKGFTVSSISKLEDNIQNILNERGHNE